MFWQYALVFLGALLFDIVPFPFAPAFTIMVFLQILFQLNIWWVVFIGVAGSVMGRYILLLYAPLIADKYLDASKNEDIKFLGKKIEENKWKGQMFIFAYCLLPLPTTPLFLGAGISKLKVRYIIPWFLIGKTISDTIALLLGKFASENTQSMIDNAFSWKSILSFTIGIILLVGLFIIDWRTLIQEKKLVLNYKILN